MTETIDEALEWLRSPGTYEREYGVGPYLNPTRPESKEFQVVELRTDGRWHTVAKGESAAEAIVLAKKKLHHLRDASENLTDAQKEKRIDEFLAGWGGLKESRSYARSYLEASLWDVKLSQDKYWREVILMQEYA